MFGLCIPPSFPVISCFQQLPFFNEVDACGSFLSQEREVEALRSLTCQPDQTECTAPQKRHFRYLKKKEMIHIK